MRRLLPLLATALALALPAALAAATGTDGTMSVKRGHAIIVFSKLTGTAIGRMASGKVRIRVLRPKVDTAPQFQHCRKTAISRTITVCRGKKLSFRALDGHYVIRLQGTGIYMSAAGQGLGSTDGTGGGIANGSMSFDDGPYQTIPDDLTPFTLGTQPPPPPRR